MPTYVYRCKACAHEFEELQKFSDEPLKVCPNCQKPQLVRIIGGAGLVFKGSGFYLTDYKNKSISESKPSPKTTDKAEKKGEAKAEKKDETTPSKPDKAAGDSSAPST